MLERERGKKQELKFIINADPEEKKNCIETL